MDSKKGTAAAMGAAFLGFGLLGAGVVGATAYFSARHSEKVPARRVADTQASKLRASTPDQKLGSIWLKLSDEREHAYEDLKELYLNLRTMPDSSDADVIDRDIPRTFPQLKPFDTEVMRAKLRRVLVAYSNYDKEVGYVQGMNFLVAYLLLHCDNEIDAFVLFHRLMMGRKYHMREMFSPGMPDLQAYFNNIQFNALFVVEWFTTLFVYSMPPAAVEEVWDGFFEFGWPYLFKVYLVLMQEARLNIIGTPFTTCIAYLKSMRLDTDARGMIEGTVADDHAAPASRDDVASSTTQSARTDSAAGSSTPATHSELETGGGPYTGWVHVDEWMATIANHVSAPWTPRIAALLPGVLSRRERASTDTGAAEAVQDAQQTTAGVSDATAPPPSLEQMGGASMGSFELVDGVCSGDRVEFGSHFRVPTDLHHRALNFPTRSETIRELWVAASEAIRGDAGSA